MPLTENYLVEQYDNLMELEERYNRLKSNANAANLSDDEKFQQRVLWSDLLVMQRILRDLAKEPVDFNQTEIARSMLYLNQLKPENLQGMLTDMEEWPGVTAFTSSTPPPFNPELITINPNSPIMTELPPPIQLGGVDMNTDVSDVLASQPLNISPTLPPEQTTKRIDAAMSIIERNQDQFSVTTNTEKTAITKISNNATYADCFNNGELDRAKLFDHVRNLEKMLLTYVAGRPESDKDKPVVISGSDPANCAILAKFCEMHGLEFISNSPATFPADNPQGELLQAMKAIAQHEYSLHIDTFGKVDPTDLNIRGAENVDRHYTVLPPEQPEAQKPLNYAALQPESLNQLNYSTLQPENQKPLNYSSLSPQSIAYETLLPNEDNKEVVHSAYTELYEEEDGYVSLPQAAVDATGTPKTTTTSTKGASGPWAERTASIYAASATSGFTHKRDRDIDTSDQVTDFTDVLKKMRTESPLLEKAQSLQKPQTESEESNDDEWNDKPNGP